MIEIVGLSEGQEYEAAVHIRRLLLRLWPDLAQSQKDTVRIFVGLKLYGYKVEDLDLVVIGRFSDFRSFDVEYAFRPRDGEPFVPRQASVRNLALVIEVKSHDATGVKFEDKVASVRYWRNGVGFWECVTEKNRTQMFEFKRYLADRGIDRIFVQDLVLFTGLKEADLPKRPHNCLGANASFERLLNVLGQISGPRRNDRNATIMFGLDEVFDAVLDPSFPLFETLEPTPLDRRRMDRIAKSALPEAWLEDLGQRQVLLRGRGGVGKTVILLQMAYRAFDQYQQRSLILTFNKALVADLRRTMALLGVPRSVERGGVAIETVHAFIGRLMLGLDVITSYEGFLDTYEETKEMLLFYLKDGVISAEDFKNLTVEQSDEFAWDLVFVDEGQDWPRNEIEILRAAYGPQNLLISDGVDQFVRDSVADWSRGVNRNAVRVRRLRRCLRMKANLALFVSDMARDLSLDDWDLEPNVEAVGGRVIIVEGDLAADHRLFERLRDEALALGNYPIDMLACIPPALADGIEPEALCRPARTITRNGGRVWDGTTRDVREHFPTDRDALRFVQYDSCRGLEGWTVINYGFDEFWEYKYRQWLTDEHEDGELFDSPDGLAAAHASRWVMIPLTRAMDTLVINVSAQSSRMKEALLRITRRRLDFVEWIRL